MKWNEHLYEVPLVDFGMRGSRFDAASLSSWHLSKSSVCSGLVISVGWVELFQSFAGMSSQTLKHANIPLFKYGRMQIDLARIPAGEKLHWGRAAWFICWWLWGNQALGNESWNMNNLGPNIMDCCRFLAPAMWRSGERGWVCKRRQGEESRCSPRHLFQLQQSKS